MSNVPQERESAMVAPSTAALEQAAEWVVRLNDAAVTQADFASWQAWLGEHPAHARAFHEVQDTWQRSASVSHPSSANAAALKRMRTEVATLVDAPRRRRRFVFAWVAAAASVIAVIVGVATWYSGGTSTVQTTTAELRSVRLPDGSRVALGPETQLKIEFSEHTRSLTMALGEAYFEVTHSRERPFSVNTPAGRVVAVGTAFSVHAADDRVTVAVTAGTVRIEPLDGVGPVVVSAGHRFIRDRSQTGVEPLVSVADAVAWREGRLEYQGEPLRVVVSDINRYSSIKLRIADPALGELRYTGTVFPDSLDAWLTSIEGVFPVRIETVDGQRLVVHAQPDRSN